MSVITLTTDFGETDPAVGTIKGVIYNIYPEAKIVNITNNIAQQDIWQANFVLSNSYSYFPKGSIHLCIVDPGVGGLRKPVLITSRNYFFIGPDNGIFTGILEKEEVTSVTELTEKKYWLKDISNTFHGRDIFSPVAANLAKGEIPEKFGKSIKKESLHSLPLSKPVKNGNALKGLVQYIDRFGNLITNIPNEYVIDKVFGKFKNFHFTGLMSSYSKGEPKKLFAIKGSHGFIELSINKGNAAKLTSAEVGDKVELSS